MAIYHVMHNQADRSDWDVIDAWVDSKGLDHVLAEIGATLRMNGIPTSQLQRELNWWRGQITKPGEN